MCVCVCVCICLYVCICLCMCLYIYISLLYIIYHISLLHPRWDEQCRGTMITVPPQLTSSLPSFSYPASFRPPPPASSWHCKCKNQDQRDQRFIAGRTLCTLWWTFSSWDFGIGAISRASDRHRTFPSSIHGCRFCGPTGSAPSRSVGRLDSGVQCFGETNSFPECQGFGST